MFRPVQKYDTSVLFRPVPKHDTFVLFRPVPKHDTQTRHYSVLPETKSFLLYAFMQRIPKPTIEAMNFIGPPMYGIYPIKLSASTTNKAKST